MPTPSRALTNDYKDCKLIKLDSNDPKSPLVVMQEGYAPERSELPDAHVLPPARRILDRRNRPQHACPTAKPATSFLKPPPKRSQALSGLLGKPLIRELPVTEADIQAYKTRVQGGSPEELLRGFLARYRAAKGKA